MIVLSPLSFADSPRVLWVFSWHKDLPWQQEIERGFESHFESTLLDSKFYYEYLDSARFKDLSHTDAFIRYITSKYKNKHLDIVFFEGEPASQVYLNNAQLFAQSQVILINPGVEVGNLPDSTAVISAKLDYQKATSSFLQLNPNKDVVIVAGDEPAARSRTSEVKSFIKEQSPHVSVELLVGLSLPTVKNKVALLSKNSVVLYLLMFDDEKGEHYIPYQVAEQLASSSSVPVYSFWTSLLRSGIVGGYMIDGQRVGEQAALLLESGVSVDSINSFNTQTHGFYFDARQLEAWEIDEELLPVNATVLFAKRNIIEEYFVPIMTSFTLFILLVFVFRYIELKKYTTQLNGAKNALRATNESLMLAQEELTSKNKKLEDLSITDHLTQLYNRTYLEKTLERELERAQRYGNHLSIILVDIDHFKKVNDNFGHQMGDKVLQAVANVLKSNLRSIDSVGRWGGEEFLILCPNSSLRQATLLAEKLRSEVERVPINRTSRITASFGVACFHNNTSEQLINEADVALYRSKDAGRNCVCA